MIAALEARLRDRWSRVRQGSPPQRLAFLKLGLQEYPEPQVPLLLLAFADAEKTPCAVAKIARDAAGDAAVEAEAVALESVARLLPESMHPVLPNLLQAGPMNGRACVLMTALPGEVELHNTWSTHGARRRGEPILSALAWALKMAQASQAEPLRLGEWIGETELTSALDAAADWEPGRRQALERQMRDAWDTQWPTGFAHGDYFPGNLLFRRRVLSGVVDWAMACERQPMFLDVLTYEFSFFVQAARRGQTVNRSTLEAVHGLPPFAALRQRLIPLGISVSLGSAARLGTLLWLRRAARDCQRPQMVDAFLRILAAEADAIRAVTAR